MDGRYLAGILVLLYGVSVVNCQGRNIAREGHANQTANLGFSGFEWTADKAIDGCLKRDNPDIDKCCSASDHDTENFWRVDFLAAHEIFEIRVYGRTQPDQLSGFNLSVLEDGMEVQIGPVPAAVDDVYTVPIAPPRNVTGVIIRRPVNILTICEVEVYEECADGLYGDGCESTCGRCLNNDACNKINGACPSGCQDGWHGDGCDKRDNIAMNGTASQSGTADVGRAGLAVDGCTNQTAGSDCCSSTQPANDTSWTVQLDATYRVGTIVVWGKHDREDELSNFTLYAFNGTEQLLYTNTVPYENGTFTVHVDPEITVQNLTIRRSTPTPASLTICEVQVFEACPDGHYGDACSDVCGHCIDGPFCSKVTGECRNGCAAGWNGTTCDDECVAGFYGEDCNSTCGQCLGDAICNITDGACPGDDCERGWTGATCSDSCFNNTYGFNCNETCGNCITDQCDVFNGTCDDGCDAGWNGTMCSDACVSPYFGANCSGICHCTGSTTCDTVNGTCAEGCEPGWMVPSCSELCDNGTYGQDCEHQCGKCKNESDCEVVDGTCAEGCKTGWLLDNCTQSCQVGLYGEHCNQTCGSCRGNDTCLVETGECPAGCASGWMDDMCGTVCPNGTFGEDCTSRCYCANREPCNTTTGECPPGGCEAGYAGDYCHHDLNRAKGKPANQSDTFDDGTFLWNASLAVDGNTAQNDPATQKTCSSTGTASSEPWWYVDLEAVSVIDSLLIYGRAGVQTDQLVGFILYLSNSTNVTGETPMHTDTSTSYGIDDNGIYNVTLRGPTLARYIHVQLPGTATLTLCEVRVFGECQDGTFGPECGDACHCADGAVCNKTTGYCPGGQCEPGWTLDNCSTECDDGFYGEGCSERCGHCLDDGACDNVNGSCDAGCVPGWQLTPLCDQVCEDRQYGHDCNSTCAGRCKDGQPCHRENGTCTGGCTAGFTGDKCETGCTAGEYGEDCTTKCGNCANDTACNATSGDCLDGCMEGYQEPLCAEAERSTGDDDDDDDDTNVGAIVGGVVGGLGVIVIGAAGYTIYKKRSKSKFSGKAMTYSPSASYMTPSTGDIDNHGYDHLAEGRVVYAGRNSTKL